MFSSEEKIVIQTYFDQQNGLAAAIALALFSVPILLAWLMLNAYFPNASGVMVALAGVAIGLITRFSGSALSRDFSVLSVFNYFAVILLAFGVYSVGIGPIPMGLFLLLVCFGAYLAVFFSKRKLSSAHSELLQKHRLMSDFQPDVVVSNKWWTMVTINFLGLLICNAIAFSILRLMLKIMRNG